MSRIPSRQKEVHYTEDGRAVERCNYCGLNKVHKNPIHMTLGPHHTIKGALRTVVFCSHVCAVSAGFPWAGVGRKGEDPTPRKWKPKLLPKKLRRTRA